MNRKFLDTSIEYLKGVGPKRAMLLKKEVGIGTFGGLLYYFPFRYIDRSKIYKISDIDSDLAYVQLKGTISDVQLLGAGRAKRLSATLTDDTGQIELVWFRGINWVKGSFTMGVEYIVVGKPALFNRMYNIAHPEIEAAGEFETKVGSSLQGIYSTTDNLKRGGLNNRSLVKLARTITTKLPGNMEETLSREIIARLSLPGIEEALINIHFPGSQRLLQRAQARLKFEELFFIQLRLLKEKVNRKQKVAGRKFSRVGEYTNRFYHDNLPFELTEAQKRVIREIRLDLGSGQQMNRLLQGDVGSGKTLVALMSMLIALDNGYQACLMAPTEILALQHYNSINRLIEGLGIKLTLLTGSTRAAERKSMLEQLLSGEINIVIGTHALIEESVVFRDPGLVVIDEQHRFGVAQRARLLEKNDKPPHVLVMTATPIPRTLAMTFYGDLDLSVIDELPPGRKPIQTYHYTDAARLKLYGFMRSQIKKGRQLYVVYPLIEESEKLDLKDLHDGYESIVREFPLPEYAVSIVHGRMKMAEKEFEMQRFIKKQTQIMVATTVIEVGVDIPNATVMVIENAERFGLAQLHQLRGRVGRGGDQSYCILMSGNKLTNEARKRLEIMVRTNDGFEIAEVDLQLRGPGDLRGTQQRGFLELKIANLVKDEKIIRYARDIAREILEEDPGLEMEKNRPMADYIHYLDRKQTDWSSIG